MRSVALLSLAALAVTCGPSPDVKLPSFPGLQGGTTGSGGVSASGGSTPKGGGGAGGKGSGGDGSGGVTKTGTGGATGSGGRTADAGVGRDGPRGTGGGGGGATTVRRDAGRGGTGGSTDAGRDVFVGRDFAFPGTGGISGRDASIPARDTAAASCYAAIADNGYACGSAAPCSECEDQNGNSKEAECQKGIDCLAAAGPSCDSNCQLNCLNKAGDSPVHTCIKALMTAACSGPGC
jgi:hypothetical protein